MRIHVGDLKEVVGRRCDDVALQRRKAGSHERSNDVRQEVTYGRNDDRYVE